jgi:hypothetical protein
MTSSMPSLESLADRTDKGVPDEKRSMIMRFNGI